MKLLITFLATVAAVGAIAAPAFAEDLQTHAQHALAKVQAATGLPPWAVIAILIVVLVAIVVALTRRRASQAVIKTRLG